MILSDWNAPTVTSGYPLLSMSIPPDNEYPKVLSGRADGRSVAWMRCEGSFKMPPADPRNIYTAPLPSKRESTPWLSNGAPTAKSEIKCLKSINKFNNLHVCNYASIVLFIYLPLAGSWSAISTWSRLKPGVITRAKSGSVLSSVGNRKGIRQLDINKTAI